MINTMVLKGVGILLLVVGIYAAGYISRNGEIADLKAQTQVYKGKLQELADASKRSEERVKKLEAERTQRLSKLTQLEQQLNDIFNDPLTCQGIINNVREWANGH